MSLDLDQRQRAMLQEMRIRVWWPESPPPAVSASESVGTAPAPPASAPVSGAATPHAMPAAPGHTPVVAPVAPRLAEGLTLEVSAIQLLGMAALAATIAACEACALCRGRKAAVFPSAAPVRQADWLVVGDPPTAEDERAGAAFAGDAGILLDNMLRAVQRTRDASGAAGAWLTNVVKCRPAVVRNPEPDELARCAAYLRREIALVQPRVILAMGRFAALSLLVGADPEVMKVPFGKLRGRVHDFEGVPVVVTYSPARLLRAQEDKAGAWVDLCLAQATARRPQAGDPSAT